jgi:hypothetical protein
MNLGYKYIAWTILILAALCLLLACLPGNSGDPIVFLSGGKSPMSSFLPGDGSLSIPTANVCKSAIILPYNSAHWTYLPLENSALNLTGEMTNFYVNDLFFLFANKVLAGTSRELLQLTDKKSEPVNYRTHLLSQDVEKVEMAPDGKLWFSYKYYYVDNWISSWDGKSVWHNYPLKGNIVDLAVTRDNITWVSFAAGEKSNAGVMYFKNGYWHNYILGDGSEENNTVLALLATSDGAIWFSTNEELFRLKDDKVTKFTRQLNNIECDELKSIDKQHLAEGYDGTVWGNIGYLLYNFDGKNWKTYYGPHFRDENLNDVAVAKDGTVWAGQGFIKNGQKYLFKLPFTMINTIEISPDGSVWYGTFAGIYIYDNKEF